MSYITIYIPKREDMFPDRQALLYQAVNAHHAAQQAGHTTGISYARQGWYAGALGSRKEKQNQENDYTDALATTVEIPTLKDELKTHPGATVNNLILTTEAGARITFDDVKIDVKKENTIVTTALAHRDGSVKEFIQAKDYSITLNGTVRTDSSGQFPFEALKLLNELLSTKTLIAVASRYINDIFGVYQVVFKSGDFNQSSMRGMNVMPYKLTLDSDMDYDFLVI